MMGANKTIGWIKLGILCALTLNLVFMGSGAATGPVTPAAAAPEYKLSDADVLKKALFYDRDNPQRNIIEAVRWYAIYIDREPAAAVRTAWWSDLQRHQQSLIYSVNEDLSLAKTVRSERDWPVVKRCVEGAGGSLARFSNPPQPESVLKLGPGPQEVWVFADIDFGGVWESLSPGNYYTPAQMKMPDNALSSLMVGDNVIAYLCSDTYLNGVCSVFVPRPPRQNPQWNHHPWLGNNEVGNDSVSSIRVELKDSCTPGPDEATLFMHPNQQAPCQKLSIGAYPNADRFGLPNDSVSSIRVGVRVQARLCADINYSGSCEVLTRDDSNLGDNQIGDDRLSSLKVERRP